MVDVQALAGDSVDNVPGAPGIGVKTAALLINEFGSLDALLDRAEEITQPKRRQTLIENRAQIELSRQLVQLDCHMPLDFTLDDLELRDPDPDTLLGFLAEMEFRTLSKRIADRLGAEAPVIPDTDPAGADPSAAAPEWPAIAPDTYECVATMDALDTWIARIRAHGHVAVDTETTSLNEMQAELVGISLAVVPGQACYIPLQHRDGQAEDLFSTDALAEGQLPFEAVLAALKPVLEDDSILKIGQRT